MYQLALFYSRLALVLALVGGVLPLYSQFSAEGFTPEQEAKLTIRVKQLDEFMNRFNYERDIYNQDLVADDSLVFKRQLYLLSLFDRNYLNEAQLDTGLEQQITTFLDLVTDTAQPRFIRFHDGQWHAEGEAVFSYGGKEYTARVTLQTALDSAENSKWVLTGFQAAKFSLTPVDTQTYRALSPVSHELNFGKLAKVTETDAQNILRYTSESYTPDYLSIALFLIQTGQLKIQYFKTVKYYFAQVPGYVFEVRNFDRNTYNSGWLISCLYPQPIEQPSKK